MYVPLSHPAGDAQCDFGQAKAIIGGVEQTVHYFVLDLPHSDACFVKAYPAETTEAFCDGRVSAFSFLGGVPRSILYDNTRLAVANILGDGREDGINRGIRVLHFPPSRSASGEGQTSQMLPSPAIGLLTASGNSPQKLATEVTGRF